MSIRHTHAKRLFITGFLSFLAAASLVPSSLLLAQPVAGKSQPDRFDFGIVRAGATVEGSVRIFEDGDDIAGISFKVQPPPFAKIKHVELNTQTYGTLGTKIVCDISLSINTGGVGEHAGTIDVQVGSQQLKIPIKVNVLAEDPKATRVLVVETPFEKFSTDDASLFDPWLRVVKSANLDAHYVEVVRQHPVVRDLDLSKFDVILLGESGVVCLLDTDIAKLKQFVNDGGRLIVCANAFYSGTVEKANELFIQGGLRMTDTEPRDTHEFDLKGDDLAVDPLTEHVRLVKCFRPSPIAVTDTSKAKILVKAPLYPGEGFVAVGRHGKGEIIALGQSLWWNWIAGPKYKGSDNEQLLKNLVTKRETSK